MKGEFLKSSAILSKTLRGIFLLKFYFQKPKGFFENGGDFKNATLIREVATGPRSLPGGYPGLSAGGTGALFSKQDWGTPAGPGTSPQVGQAKD